MMTQDLFDGLMPRLERRARRLTRSPEAAQDLAQEAALRLWQQVQAGHQIDTPEHYAMTLIHNLARARWRRQVVMQDVDDIALPVPPLAPARLACAELRAAILRLPDNQRVLMELVLQGEVSPRRLAARLSLAPGTVMSRLARARAQLRADMDLPQGASVTELF